MLRGFHWELQVPLIEWGKKIELNWDILRIIQALPYWVRTVHCASALIVFLDRSEELGVQPYNNTKTHIKSQSWCWCCGENRALLLRAVSREILQEKNNRLMSLCLIAVHSAAYPLLKTCPAGGPMGEWLCTGRKWRLVPASVKCTVSPQMLSTQHRLSCSGVGRVLEPPRSDVMFQL